MDGDICQIPFGTTLQQLSMQWNYIVGNRNRWSQRKESRDEVAHRAAAAMASFGVSSAQLRKLAASRIVEVGIPYRRENQGWEARIMPWESLLSDATREYRSDNLIVIRHLERSVVPRIRTPKSLAIVEAAPGPLWDRFDFSGEANLVSGSFHSIAFTVHPPIENPTATTLRDKLAEYSPDVIHITGFDTHQGAELLKAEPIDSRLDGLLLRGDRQAVESMESMDVARLLTVGRPKPVLVGFNCANSADRTGPLTVANGAATAISFKNTIDDALSELFFVNFYRNWRETNWNTLAAFMQAFESLRPYRDRMRGTSIVLWNATSALRSKSSKTLDDVRSEMEFRSQSRQAQWRDANPEDSIRNLVEVVVDVEKHLNYALLHNQRSILRSFAIHFHSDRENVRRENVTLTSDAKKIGAIRDIQIEVILHVGAESFPYRTTATLDANQPILNIVSDSRGDASIFHGEGIRVPLTSQLARSVDERMQTSLYINVEWERQVLYRHTHSVFLQPVDEWMLDDRDISWIPSFVQPRDSAVAQIVRSAQKYLKCLADYIPAGFDGYQSYNPDASNKYDHWAGVDYQVQALWHALVLDTPLGYINPPPSYRQSAQRLRTPRQILAQGRGTCVDLAILMASCLEWIEVYPVLFLLDEHAFPGYWRSEEGYNDFLAVAEARVAQSSFGGIRLTSPTEPWICDRTTYGELKRYVDDDLLVPLESVWLTTSSGFREAIDEAKQSYFSDARNPSFYSMVNIARAREAGVTPLPLCDSN